MSKAKGKKKSSNSPRLLIANGVNLDLLGRREPGIYGHETLDDLEARIRTLQSHYEFQFECFQSNHEATYLETISQPHFDGLILNPGAWTHTSLALRDRLLATKTSFVEVHISNIWARESFRHHSYLSDLAIGVISGFGLQGYELAIQALLKHLNVPSSAK